MVDFYVGGRYGTKPTSICFAYAQNTTYACFVPKVEKARMLLALTIIAVNVKCHELIFFSRKISG